MCFLRFSRRVKTSRHTLHNDPIVCPFYLIFLHADLPLGDLGRNLDARGPFMRLGLDSVVTDRLYLDKPITGEEAWSICSTTEFKLTKDGGGTLG